jgi:hypothetical protein
VALPPWLDATPLNLDAAMQARLNTDNASEVSTPRSSMQLLQFVSIKACVRTK